MKDKFQRYNRQIIIPEIGEEGQNKLEKANVLVVGTGGLGSPAALYVAAAGIGTIGIVDSDKVELSNLNRQILHSAADIGHQKTESACDTLNALNPDIQIIQHPYNVDSKNTGELIKKYDVVIDATDNLVAKFLLNETCVSMNKILCHGSVLKFFGQAATIVPDKSPCLKCLYPAPNSIEYLTPSEAGVIGTIPGIIGTVQAMEAIKVILGIGDLLEGRLFSFDALKMEAEIIYFERNPECPVCSKNR